MKIKLGILEKDTGYLNRMVPAFGAKYADKLEIYSFTDKQIALDTVESARIDVLIASDVFDIDIVALPKRCGFAYFVDSSDVEIINNQKAICKFQKAELIYKQILSIYAEKAENVSGVKLNDKAGRVIAFVSASGGVGSSSAAAACAIHYAARGKKTLYLNLEKFGDPDRFFSAEGQFDLSDVIFAVKSKKSNLQMKLESYVRHDPRGVYFFATTKVALDIMEFGSREILQLLTELELTGAYEYIILDLDFALEQESLDILRATNTIVMVSDGSELGNSKTYRAYVALNILEQDKDALITQRMKLLYNKFSNKTGKTLAETELKELGGAPRYQHATTQEIISALAALDLFDRID
jgi:cellulose biosynthesis protein BcsQ